MEIKQIPKWNHYHDSDLVEYVPDQIERPPLLGLKRFVPEGLYDQPWDHVGDAYGKATLTPYYIEALTSDDAGDVEFGVYGLTSATTHQGSVYPASKLAVPFLAELLALDIDKADLACYFLARIALGEQHFISTPAEFYKTRYYGVVRKHQQQIMTCWERTRSLEALRLLCFFPKALSNDLDCSYEAALQLEDGHQERAFVRQATMLLVQGFLAAERNYSAKGYPRYGADFRGETLHITAHIELARQEMASSPSLLVRGSAAICLVYTGVLEPEVLQLLAILAAQELRGVYWVWDENFSAICKKAWLFGADLDALLSTNQLQTLEYTTYMPEGAKMGYYSQSELMIEAACRVFPMKYEKDKKGLPSLLPSALSMEQRRVLQRMLEVAPDLFGFYTVAALNLPQSIEGARRLLGESAEVLCTDINGLPLWFLLEQAVREDELMPAVEALAQVDGWRVLDEVYRTWGLSQIGERCTLSLRHPDPKIEKEWECRLQSLIADTLQGYGQQIRLYLEQWLVQVEAFQGSDWSSKTKAQRLGICLLALARTGELELRFAPLVRPYHTYAQYSEFPTVLLKEVLEQLPTIQREAVCKEFRI